MALSEGPRPAPTTLPEGPYKEALLRAATFRWGIYNFVMRLQNSEVYGQKGSYRKEYQLVKEKYSIGRESITAMGAAVGVAWKAGWQKVSGVVSFNLMKLNDLETEQAKHQYLNQFKQEGIDSNQFHIAIAIGATKENVVRTEIIPCLYDRLLGDDRPLKAWGDLVGRYGNESSLADLTDYMWDAIAAFTDPDFSQVPADRIENEERKLYALAIIGISEINHDFLGVFHGKDYMLNGRYFGSLVEDIKGKIQTDNRYPKLKAFFEKNSFDDIEGFKRALLKLLSEKLHKVGLKSFDDLDVRGCNIFNGLELKPEALEQYKAVFDEAIALPVDSSAGTVGEDREGEMAGSAAERDDKEDADSDEEFEEVQESYERVVAGERIVKEFMMNSTNDEFFDAVEEDDQEIEADKTAQPLNKNPTKSSNNTKVVLSGITIITGLVAYKAIDVHLPKLSFPNKLLGALAVALLMLIVVLSIASCVRQYDGQQTRKVARRSVHEALSSSSSSSSANGDMAGGSHSRFRPEEQVALPPPQQQQVYLRSQNSEGEDFPAEFLMKRSNGDSSDPQGLRNMFPIDPDDDQHTFGPGDNTDDGGQTFQLRKQFMTGGSVTCADGTSQERSQYASRTNC